MKLRERFVITLVVITVILAAPATVAMDALADLRDAIENISVHDAEGALQLGQLQAAFRDMNNSERIYLALANYPAGPQSEETRLMVIDHIARVQTRM